MGVNRKGGEGREMEVGMGGEVRERDFLMLKF